MAGRLGSFMLRRACRSMCSGEMLLPRQPTGGRLRVGLLPQLQADRRTVTQIGSGSGGRIGGLDVKGPPETFPFVVKGLNHLAIAVPDLAAAADHYRLVYGAYVTEPLDLPHHGVTVVFVRLENLSIELLYPLGDESPVKNFLEKNPRGGIHHFCLTVNNLSTAMEHMKSHGVDTLRNKPQIGAHGHPVMFVNPKSNHGVLCELEEVHVQRGVAEEEDASKGPS
eukprot:TRINITY_DN7839_c0_g1_i1.p1 TRINITY_DN7839_c0_g1~~TRINITY_DN7839_c0_g1_i1.p1  ORF type:complete len:224 (+),score=24.89 TRINITY_DN7839_c0_g1_i1:500-1171(+)